VINLKIWQFKNEIILTYMTNQALISQLDQLPESIKLQVIDYMSYLITKYSTKKKKIHPKAGCMKGVVTYISRDFDAPLEDFKEYM
jgi:hypothetical protein